MSTTVSINEKGIYDSIVSAVANNKDAWSQEDLSLLVGDLIKNELIMPRNIQGEIASSLISRLERHIEQEFFVGVYNDQQSAPLFFVPSLRLENIESTSTPQDITLRHFDNSRLQSTLYLECLSTPDGQNNIYYLESNCQ